MALKFPNSMNECIYFTNRTIGSGKAVAWVYRKPCPKCKKATMGKPVEKGKKKIRALEYVCPGCGYTEEKSGHEDSLTMEIQYTCPHCSKSGEATTEYKRKSFNGIQAYVFSCIFCSQKIGITKKMKEKKGAVNED
ncbi:MAG TPA: hypothetical protein VJI46_03920 [Candidatus Nanoarchaeia archaeon]|nr:hypothetical protein [Candidatus Nanoarchaeia archaeon]